MRQTRTTLLIGGRIYSPGVPDATAMAVTNGTVAWIGKDEPAKALHPGAEIVELHGAFVTPAFVDAHVHATDTGLHLASIDLTTIRHGDELLEAVRAAANEQEILIAHGWDESAWSSARLPSRFELDAAAGSVPVYLSRIDVHSALVSSALIELAPHARFAHGWSEHGPITAEAHHALRRAARAAVTEEQRGRAQRAFLRAAATRGVATVHECGGPEISGEADLADLMALGAQPDLPNVVGYWGERRGIDTARRLGARGLAGDLFIDGALGSHTAALNAPYFDKPECSGNLYLDHKQIAEHIIACTEAGLQAGFHVIGDAGVAEAIAGFRLAEHTVGRRALVAGKHRLEHLEMVTDEQAGSLATWGVSASVQPMFDALWGGEDGMYVERLGADRGPRLNPLSTLAAKGMVLAFGSDTPVSTPDPWLTIRAAVHHRTDGFEISARAAFNAHTRGAHRAARAADGSEGTLTPGAPAVYAVWDAGQLVTPGQEFDARIRRWSTDPRSGVPGLPTLDDKDALPHCLRTVNGHTVLYDELTQPA